MNYSDRLKVQWFLPQRNGTRTVTEILNKLDFKFSGHFLLTTGERKNYYTIINVRNPYSRVVSLFHFYCFSICNFKFVFNDFVNLIQQSQRDKFIRDKDGKEICRNKDSYNIHYDFFIEEILGRAPEKFVRLEYFEEDLKSIPFLEKYHNLIDEYVKVNRYKNEFSKMIENQRDWRNYYNEENSLIIYERLKEQFLKYGYNKNSWKDVTP